MSPTKSDFEPERMREYKLFLVWQILPRPVRELGEPYLDQEGIDDETIRELAGIKTQKQFAEKYQLSPDTLTDWKKKPIPDDLKELADWRYYTKHLVKNIGQLLYEGFKTNKDSNRAKLLLEMNGEYIQRTEVQVNGLETLFDNVKELLEKVSDNDVE